MSSQILYSGIVGGVIFSLDVWEMAFASFCDLDIFQIVDKSADFPKKNVLKGSKSGIARESADRMEMQKLELREREMRSRTRLFVLFQI